MTEDPIVVKLAADFPVPSLSEQADLLDAAVDEILVRGWCQGTLGDDDGRVCLVGSLQVAAGMAELLRTPMMMSAFERRSLIEEYQEKISKCQAVQSSLAACHGRCRRVGCECSGRR